MHETVICDKIQKDAQSKAAGKTIKSITIEVGELGPLPPIELKNHLELLTKWKVNLKTQKAIVECDCGFNGAPTILDRGHDYCLYLCSKCGRVPKLIKGADIIIKEVKF